MGKEPVRRELESFAGPSLDHPDSPFWQAMGLTPDETWARSRQAMEALLKSLESMDPDPEDVSVELLRSSHERIFAELFPCDAGRFRWKHKGGWETGPFGVGAGSGPASARRAFKGTTPKGIERALAKEFDRFQGDADSMREESDRGERVAVRDAARIAGRLYARILKIHPFVDGNLRAAFIVLQAALFSLDLPLVELHDLQDEHDQALIAAFTPGGRNHSYDPITDLIAREIEKTVRPDADAL